jgi:hypothetical protein
MIRIKQIVTALIAAAVLAAVWAGPASAATHNESRAVLRFPARGGTFKIQRTLPNRLAGQYLWAGVANNERYLHGRDRRFERKLNLNGRYRIVDTLKPAGRIYVHNAQLINLRTGGRANLPTQPVNEGNGRYIWGSFIMRRR